MGTSGDPSDDTKYFDQYDRIWMEASAEAAADSEARRRWRSIILSSVIIVIAGAVMGLMIWGGR